MSGLWVEPSPWSMGKVVVVELSTSVIVPWRGGDPVRERLWAWNRARWRSTGYEIIECDDGTEPFSRGRSINRGVAQSSGERLILADADTALSSIAGLENPIAVQKREARGQAWYVMYGFDAYDALTANYTEVILSMDPKTLTLPTPDAIDCRERITSHSGLLMMTRAQFDEAGGYDEGFCGWGFEDDAFWHAMSTLIGDERRLPRAALHLYHEHIESERFEQPYIDWNKALSDTYAARTGNVPEMKNWLAARKQWPSSLTGPPREPRRFKYPVR